jgi:hypothetical protein
MELSRQVIVKNTFLELADDVSAVRRMRTCTDVEYTFHRINIEQLKINLDSPTDFIGELSTCGGSTHGDSTPRSESDACSEQLEFGSMLPPGQWAVATTMPPGTFSQPSTQSCNQVAYSRRGTERMMTDATVSKNGTTLVIRKLSPDFSRVALLEALDFMGYSGKYDFVFVPVDQDKQSFGYAIVNMIAAVDAVSVMENIRDYDTLSEVEVKWNVEQGCASLIRQYRSNRVMHRAVEDEFKPALFAKSGRRIAFPSPKWWRHPGPVPGADFWEEFCATHSIA